MIKLLCKAILILMIQVTYSQQYQIELIESKKDYYKSISFLTEGEIKWFEKPVNNIEGESFRFVITNSGIYNQVYIERISFGPEGCCRKIESKKLLPIDQLFDSLNFKGERSGVQFVNWITETSLVISINKNDILIEISNDKTAMIKKL